MAAPDHGGARAAARFVGGVVCVLGLAGFGCQAPTERGLVLVGVTVIDGSEQPLEGALLVIEGARITAVGPQTHVTLPKGMRLVNMSGRFVVPEHPSVVGAEARALLQSRVAGGNPVEAVLNAALREAAAGALAAGAAANLRVLSADPRHDLANLESVHARVVAGRLESPTESN